jgi:hypothetical protein
VKEISKTTVSGIAMLLVVAGCMVLLVMGKFTVQETILAVGLLTGSIISAIGHFYAADSNAPVTISQTTVQNTDAGKVVKVETDLPESK